MFRVVIAPGLRSYSCWTTGFPRWEASWSSHASPRSLARNE
jgi:hypothetical protein